MPHARHAAWRVGGQLRCLIERPLWGDPGTLRAVLRNAAAELTRAERLIAGEDIGEVHMSQHKDEEGASEEKGSTGGTEAAVRSLSKRHRLDVSYLG